MKIDTVIYILRIIDEDEYWFFCLHISEGLRRAGPGAAVRDVSLESLGRGFEAAFPQILRGKGLSRFIPSQDPTHMWEPLALGLPPIYVRD